MKLYEAMRKGCELTDWCKGTYVRASHNEACAVGAAFIGLHGKVSTGLLFTHNAWPALGEHISKGSLPAGLKNDPMLPSIATLRAWIYIMSDKELLSREAIAEWIEWLEVELGIDMRLELMFRRDEARTAQEILLSMANSSYKEEDDEEEEEEELVEA